jgi:Outer membrane protein beta-barrel domain
MLRYINPLIFLFIAHTSLSQSFDLGIMAGGSNYQGDLQEKNYDLELMQLCYGASITYNINQNWSVRGEVWRGNLSGSDVTSNRQFATYRNLSFHTRVYEVGLVGIYRFPIKDDGRFSPYFFGGTAVYRINPYTHGEPGQKSYLFPLSTEGQGLSQYPDKKEHRYYGLSIPFGFGLNYEITPKWRIALEMGFRKTFTDYIDDVSDMYVSEDILREERGSKAVDLAYRSDELPGGNPRYPDAGSPRGNPQANDLYYNTIFRVQFRAFAESSYQQRIRRQMECPNVW